MRYIVAAIIGSAAVVAMTYKFVSKSFAAAEYTEELDRTLDAEGIEIIDAGTNNGAIEFDGSNGEQIVIHIVKKVRGRTQEEAAEFARQVEVHVEQNGSELKIYKEQPERPKHINVAVSYEIQAPSTVDLKLRTSNGKIRIDNADSAVYAQTSNGSVSVQGGEGHVELHTSNGGIKVEEVTGRIHARSSNGAITASLGTLEQEGFFSTSNGAIKVKVHEGIAPITATTSNGSINLTLPADFSGQVDATTSNGRAHSDFPIVGTTSKRHLSGQIGEGGEAILKLKTSNGSIHVRVQEKA